MLCKSVVGGGAVLSMEFGVWWRLLAIGLSCCQFEWTCTIRMRYVEHCCLIGCSCIPDFFGVGHCFSLESSTCGSDQMENDTFEEVHTSQKGGKGGKGGKGRNFCVAILMQNPERAQL